MGEGCQRGEAAATRLVIASAGIDAVPGFTILDNIIPAVVRQAVTAGVAVQ